jgi:hypothetical protein
VHIVFGVSFFFGVKVCFSGINRDTYRKVPCLAALPHSRIELNQSNFKGDTINDAETCGVLSINSDTYIRNCSFAHFKSGGIMI